MPRETSVTDTGLDSSEDLQRTTEPTEDDINSLDKAMDAAGLGDVSLPATPAVPVEPVAPVPPAEPVTPAAPVVEPKKDGDEEPIVPDLQKPKDGEPAASAEPVVPTDEVKPKAGELSAEEIKALKIDDIKPPEGISPRNVVNFDKLRTVAKHWQTEASRVPELEARLAKLEAGESIPEQVKAELEDLRKFRSVFDVENDPEFKKQFEETTKRIDDEVIAIMKKYNLPESVEKELRAAGLDKVPADFWEEQILPKLPFIDRERLQKRLADRADIVDSREQRLAKAMADRPAYLAEQQQRQSAEFQQYQGEIDATVAELTKEISWARMMEVPTDATPDQKAQIDQHNKMVEELGSHLKEALWPTTAAQRAEVACAAVAAVKLASDVKVLNAQLAARAKEVEELNKQLNGIKSAGKLPSPGTRVAVGSEKVVNLSGMSDEDAVERGLQEAESL